MSKRTLSFILSIGLCLCVSGSEKQRYIGISEQHPTGSSAISSKGLIAAYDFESYTQDGLLRDFGPFSNHGKLTQKNGIQGRFGQALVFANKEDVIILPDNNHFNLTGPLTVAAHVKIVTPNLHQHLFACNDLFVLWLTTSNKYRFADTLGQGFTTKEGIEEAREGKWHSVVAVLSAEKGSTLNSDNIKIFIDGQQIVGRHEKVWAPTELASTNACVIGGTRNGGQKHQNLPFKGVLDELQIYSRAFSEDEIKVYSNSF